MHCVATGKAAPIGCMHACHEGMHPEVLSTCTRYSRERNGECMHPCRGSIGVVRWYYASMHVVHASIGHACMHSCMHATHRCVWHACLEPGEHEFSHRDVHALIHAAAPRRRIVNSQRLARLAPATLQSAPPLSVCPALPAVPDEVHSGIEV